MKLRYVVTVGIIGFMCRSVAAQAATEPTTAVQPRAARTARTSAGAIPPEAHSISTAPEPADSAQAAEPAKAPRAAVAPVATTPLAPPRMPGSMQNVRIEVNLTDSKGVPKTLTMLVADGASGMNRTINNGSTTYQIASDASPTIIGNKIRLGLVVDVSVPIESDKEKVSSSTALARPLALRQSQTLILSDGETVEVARAADPVSDRTFVLTVSAKIQK